MPWRAILTIAGLHAALILWAGWAWIHGPFQGEGVIDGAEVLALALEGSAGPFETKSPLYPALLGWVLGLTGEVPWTVALCGLVSSVAVLLGVAFLTFRLAGRRAAVVAALLYALSGSTLAFSVQPLPTVFAAALLVWGAALLARDTDSPGRGSALLAGALLAASIFARLSLLPAALLLLVWAVRRRRYALVGALGVAVLLGTTFGGRSWPEGGGLNLRLANSGQRSGITDIRPGPRYHALRWQAVESQYQHEPLRDLDEEQYRLLELEVLADPGGAIRTLSNKLQLFWHGTEIVASADFRHGLERMPPAKLLLWSFALIAPLALVGLCRRRPTVLWLAVAGVLAANVLFATCARYRFPALPFLCAAAGIAVASTRSRRELWWLGGALLCTAPNWTGVRLVLPGDGWVQEGFLAMQRDRTSDEALATLEEANRLGDDARGAYLLGLCHERRWQAGGGAELERALKGYRRALRIEPDYPEAAENLVAALLRAGRVPEARTTAIEWLERIPRAGFLELNLAGILEAEGDAAGAREHAARGHRMMALRSLSQNELESARLHATEARKLGVVDRHLDGLFSGP